MGIMRMPGIELESRSHTIHLDEEEAVGLAGLLLYLSSTSGVKSWKVKRSEYNDDWEAYKVSWSTEQPSNTVLIQPDKARLFTKYPLEYQVCDCCEKPFDPANNSGFCPRCLEMMTTKDE